MAQHDYIIANQSGAAFRSDLNNGLAAIVSQNSGAAQPSTTYAYQWWADTTTGLLKIRNAANNAWITVGTLANANLGLLSLAGGTLTGALLADDSGTAALPAIAFDGDPDTGVFRAGANELGIATNGVERVEFGTTEVVFNDGGADVDFRVEGDTNANLFKVDAGTDAVSIDGNFSVTGSFDIGSLNGGPLAGFRNRIINGDMRIDQRAVVATTNDAYFTDRWQVSASTTGAYQCSQSSDAPTGFTNSLVFDVTTADTSIAASEFAIIQQYIEGSSISDLSWGSASAQAVTLSFSVKATTTGTYCVALRNSANNRSYVAEYSVVSANTWERKTITISGDTSGTWLTTNGRGISVSFSFAAGSTFRATAGSWQAGNFYGTSSQTNLLAANTNEIRITGVQLEPGPVATPFERRPIGTELALCQRYCFVAPANWLSADGGISVAGVGQFSALGTFPATMRVAPTATGVTFATSNCATPNLRYLTTGSASYGTVSSASGGGSFNQTAGTYSAEL